MFSPGLLALCLGSGSPGASAKGSASVPARGATRSAEPTSAAHTARSRGGQPGGRQTGGKSRIQSSLFNCSWLVESENWLWRAPSYLRVQSELGSGFLPLWVPKLWLLPELILAVSAATARWCAVQRARLCRAVPLERRGEQAQQRALPARAAAGSRLPSTAPALPN